MDGDTNTEWGSGSCSHTADVDGPSWFQVDLGAISTISRVAIYHRTDCCQDRLESARILVSDSPDFSNGVRCGGLSDSSADPEVSSCGGAAQGRYVTISLEHGGGNANSRALMTICEIEVWGRSSSALLQPPPPPPPPPPLPPPPPPPAPPPPIPGASVCQDIDTPNNYDYNPNFIDSELGAMKAVAFTVRAHNDAHVGFFDMPAGEWGGVGDEHYEIVL